MKDYWETLDKIAADASRDKRAGITHPTDFATTVRHLAALLSSDLEHPPHQEVEDYLVEQKKLPNDVARYIMVVYRTLRVQIRGSDKA